MKPSAVASCTIAELSEVYTKVAVTGLKSKFLNGMYFSRPKYIFSIRLIRVLKASIWHQKEQETQRAQDWSSA